MNRRIYRIRATRFVAAFDPTFTPQTREEKLTEAEALLTAGYESLAAAANEIPVQFRAERISQAAEWRVKLAEWRASTQPDGP